MLLKEYRIPLPLSVEEYRVAQLYMIAKKSREESKGAGSGVEILVNEPYTDGPGGSGQYTHKIYHIGSHLPGWFKALLPKSALTVEEEAWNAYPYTKTRYTCPFIERFYLEIETKYFGDAGEQENVFELSGAELRNLQVDVIDVVRDQLTGSDYVREEDPKLYVSLKTARGPLEDDWIQSYLDHRQLGTPAPASGDGTIMCAYKLCRVEFRYWGMQSKIEKFIHDVALRKTMLRAHRQAWAWQDEWVGLTMEDIRQIERETQEALARKMAADQASDEDEEALAHSCSAASIPKVDLNVIDKDKEVTVGEPVKPAGRARSKSRSPPRLVQELEPEPSSLASPKPADGRGHGQGPRKSWVRSNSKGALHSPSGSSTQSFDLQLANWRMESIVRESDSSSNDEFFDAEDIVAAEEYGFSPMTKWSSLEMVSSENEKGGIFGGASTPDEDSIFSASHIRRTHAVSFGRSASTTGASTSLSDSPTASPGHQSGSGGAAGVSACPTSVLVLVLHAGNVLEAGTEGPSPKAADLQTFRAAVDSAVRQHYPTMLGRVAMRLVTCPAPCAEALAVLSNLSPYSFQASPSAIDGGAFRHQDSIPLGALPLFAVSSPDFPDHVSRTVCAANQAYHEFLKSEQGQGFAGQVALIGDSVGSILGFDALCRAAQIGSRYGSENSINEEPASSAPRPNPLISISDGSGNEDAEDAGAAAASSGSAAAAVAVQGTPSRNYRKSASHPPDAAAAAASASEVTGMGEGASSLHRLLSAPPPRRSSSCSSEQGGHGRFDFEVSDFFMFGSPIALVLAYRKMLSFDDKNAPLPRPQCSQVYNLFHPTDPLAARLEPLLSARFSQLPPVNVPRYQKYPLGDGQPIHLLEYLQSHAHVFVEGLPPSGYACMGRRTSEASISSTVSGVSEALPLSTVTSLTQKWWGSRRLDFALYCPEGLANFPPHVLPHLFHASYWESMDVVGLLLRQLLRGGGGGLSGDVPTAGTLDRDLAPFVPGQPREKWLRKRTSVKIKNVTANHRANDVIVKEGEPQVLTARFMYGPLDMVALSGEKVDVHLMRDSGHWTLLGTQLTDRNGRLAFSVPKDLGLGYGLFPVKAIVRGDHTAIDFFLAIVPPKTECVVFSIDGSFTASVSVSGRDPKVRAGAVDVVRHWQELGYLIIYITGRPDMQQQRVVSWLAQHNFPHGLVSFAEGLTTEPLRHKASYLRHLQTHAEVVYHAAYGSAKDIAVYAALGLAKEQIFIVGKVSKKQQSQATVLSEGYALHLTDLKSPGLPLCRPAQGNARMVLSRGCFGLPGQGLTGPALRRRRSAKRTTSYPLSSAPPTSPGPSSTAPSAAGNLKGTAPGSSKV